MNKIILLSLVLLNLIAPQGLASPDEEPEEHTSISGLPDKGIYLNNPKTIKWLIKNNINSDLLTEIRAGKYSDGTLESLYDIRNLGTAIMALKDSEFHGFLNNFNKIHYQGAKKENSAITEILEFVSQYRLTLAGFAMLSTVAFLAHRAVQAPIQPPAQVVNPEVVRDARLAYYKNK